jgi:hypothetical protein
VDGAAAQNFRQLDIMAVVRTMETAFLSFSRLSMAAGSFLQGLWRGGGTTRRQLGKGSDPRIIS